MRAFTLVLFSTFVLLPCSSALGGSLDTLFDVLSDTLVCEGPPYPTEAQILEVGHQTVGVPESDGSLTLRVRRVSDESMEPVPTDLVARDGAALSGGFAQSAFFDLSLRSESDPAFPEVSTVGLAVEILSPDGSPATLTMFEPDAPENSISRFFGVSTEEDGFEVRCRVEFADGFSHELVLAGKAVKGVEVRYVRASLTGASQQSADERTGHLEDSFFRKTADATFAVSVVLSKSGGPATTEPFLSLETSGDCLSGPSPVERTSWGAVKSVFRD